MLLDTLEKWLRSNDWSGEITGGETMKSATTGLVAAREFHPT